ncbi:MAG: hemolysin family protein [Burkholderia sp.]|nr:hemolysin family protein [Burkholderia sp.]
MIQFIALPSALLLVMLNGFFVAAEFSLVKLRVTRVKTLGHKHGIRGHILGIVYENLDAYLSACQLGITLSSLALGWVSEPAFSQFLHPILNIIRIVPDDISNIVSFIFVFSVISFLHIVVGELVPKSIAIRQTEKVSLWVALPLYVFYLIMYPVIWMLNISANTILQAFRLSTEHNIDAHYSTDELKLILRSHHNLENVSSSPSPSTSYSNDEWNMLAHSLDFSSMTVSDLMKPTHEMIGLCRDMPLHDNMRVIFRHRFSRYPLFKDESREQISGVLHLKDLLLSSQTGIILEDLSNYIRPVQTVQPDTPALELFRRFRNGAPHFALVGQKGSKPIGFLTLDNLLAALVGQIHDEFLQGGADWTRLDDSTLIGKGSLPVVSLEQALGIDIDEGRAESVGGLVIHALGDLPLEGQQIEFERFNIVIKKMKGPRISLVRVYPKSFKKIDK